LASSTLNQMSDVIYDLGDRTRIDIAPTDRENDDAPVDPTTLRIEMTEPDGTKTAFDFPASPDIVQDGLGLYHAYWTFTQSGIHWARTVLEGNVTAAEVRGYRVADLPPGVVPGP
jgi:hypothetical protein